MKFLSILVLVIVSPVALADPVLHVSVTGAIFTSDNSKPALGDAYRDPSGLIWGSPIVIQGKVAKMTGQDGGEFCASLGVEMRLPTLDDFVQLESYLGYGGHSGYTPYTTDGKTEVLPGLVESKFWTSSEYDWPFSYVFLGGTDGGLGPANFFTNSFAIRCVFDSHQ